MLIADVAIENLKEQNEFQKGFQQLYESWGKRVVVEGGYLAGK